MWVLAKRDREGLPVSANRATRAEAVYLELVSSYQTPILNYLYRLVGDADLAEDLVQDTFIRAYQALERLDLEEDAGPRRRGWLYRIAHNVATDHLRRKALLKWLPLDDLLGLGSPEPAIQAAGEIEPVRQALARMSPDQRQVLLLFNQEGLGAEEVAEVLGISAAAARKRRQRAREQFIAVYKELTGEM